jgi:hypothetical protein
VFPTFASLALAAHDSARKGLRARVGSRGLRQYKRVCQVAARRLRMTPPMQGEHAAHGTQNVIVFIGFIDGQTESMLRDGPLACRRAAVSD